MCSHIAKKKVEHLQYLFLSDFRNDQKSVQGPVPKSFFFLIGLPSNMWETIIIYIAATCVGMRTQGYRWNENTRLQMKSGDQYTDNICQ